MAPVLNTAEPLGWPLLPVPDANGQLHYPGLAQSVREQIQVLLSTRPGEQLMNPGFGAGLENLLSDPNTGTVLHESADIVEYLFRTYAGRATPSAYRAGTLRKVGGYLATISRGLRGLKATPAQVPAQPLRLPGRRRNSRVPHCAHASFAIRGGQSRCGRAG